MSTDEIAHCESTLRSLEVAADAQSYARALIQAGKLTRFQAVAIYQGRIKGLTFGEYVILDELGRGGMGAVYKAQHRRMDRVVAIKVLPRTAMATVGAVDRFYREVKAAAKLMHPNIVAALDASEADGLHYLVMEFVDGQDLSQTVQRLGPLPIAQAVDCVLQAARGLEFAHEQGVIHRDIKPANLLFDHNGIVKILDMGLARLIDAADDDLHDERSVKTPSGTASLGDRTAETVTFGQDTAPVDEATRLTKAGEVMGTLDYMPPEQFADMRGVDERADIYSLGCTLYRLLTDRRPYPVDSLIEIYCAHCEAPIPSLRSLRPEVPQQLEDVFQKMLAKDRDDRQASMAEVIDALASCLSPERPPEPVLIDLPQEDPLSDLFDGLSDAGQEDSSRSVGTFLQPQRRTARWPRDKTTWIVGGGLIAAILILAVSLLVRNRQENTNPPEDEARQSQVTVEPPKASKKGGTEPSKMPAPVSVGPLADRPKKEKQSEEIASRKSTSQAGEGEAEMPDSDDDVTFILDGLTEVSTNGIPGELGVVGPQAFPVVSTFDENGTPHHLLAAARDGKGRLAVVAHPGFIVQESASHAQLARNLILWTSDSDAAQISHLMVAMDSFSMGKQQLVEQGFQVVDMQETNWDRMLSEADVIIVRALDLDEMQVRLLRDYVQQGGGLIAADPSWVWMQQHAKPGQTMAKDCPANRLLAPAGIEHLDRALPNVRGKSIRLTK